MNKYLELENISEIDLKDFIESIVNKVKIPEIYEHENLSFILNQSSTLTEKAATVYIDAAVNYINKFYLKYKNKKMKCYLK